MNVNRKLNVALFTTHTFTSLKDVFDQSEDEEEQDSSRADSSSDTTEGADTDADLTEDPSSEVCSDKEASSIFGKDTIKVNEVTTSYRIGEEDTVDFGITREDPSVAPRDDRFLISDSNEESRNPKLTAELSTHLSRVLENSSLSPELVDLLTRNKESPTVEPEDWNCLHSLEEENTIYLTNCQKGEMKSETLLGNVESEETCQNQDELDETYQNMVLQGKHYLNSDVTGLDENTPEVIGLDESTLTDMTMADVEYLLGQDSSDYLPISLKDYKSLPFQMSYVIHRFSVRVCGFLYLSTGTHLLWKETQESNRSHHL